MTERFKKLVSLPGPQWSQESPIVIEKGALLRDGSRNQNLLQLRLRNIQEKPLKAVVMDVAMFDVLNKSLGSVQCSFLDLEATKGASFGDDTPIWLDDETARSFRFTLSDVVFSDGSSWSGSLEMQVVGETHALAVLGDLQDQFAREVALLNPSVVPEVMTTSYGALWRCTCGAVNDSSETACAACGIGYERQRAIADPAYLEANAVAYRERQVALADETARTLNRESRKKRMRLAVTCAVGLVVLGGLYLGVNGRLVTFYVDSPSSKAQLTYVGSFQRNVQETVSTPWQKTVPMLKGATVFMSATDDVDPEDKPEVRITVNGSDYYGSDYLNDLYDSDPIGKTVAGSCP